jgi:hypothetical protein
MTGSTSNCAACPDARRWPWRCATAPVVATASRFLDDGRIEIDTNVVERAMIVQHALSCAASIAIGATARSSSSAIAVSIRKPPKLKHRFRPS